MKKSYPFPSSLENIYNNRQMMQLSDIGQSLPVTRYGTAMCYMTYADHGEVGTCLWCTIILNKTLGLWIMLLSGWGQDDKRIKDK